MSKKKTGVAALASCLVLSAVVVLAQGPQQGVESIARAQLEHGRQALRQNNYPEAVRDFQAVSTTYAKTSAAPEALLELARYYFDIAGDTKAAAVAVDQLQKGYPTEPAAAQSYLVSGRIALSRGRQNDNLQRALADFERVGMMFPTSDAVPGSIQLSGETLMYLGRMDEALAQLAKVEVEHPATMAAASAYIVGSRLLVAMDDPVGAMEDLQQVRNRWPNTPEAAIALQKLTLLHRLYVRAKNGPAFAAAESAGPAKLEGVTGIAASPAGSIYWAGDDGVGSVNPADTQKASAVLKARGITLDAAGQPYVIDVGMLRSPKGDLGPLSVPKSNGQLEVLFKISSAVQVSTGEWFIMDDDQRAIARFARDGTFINLLGTKAAKLAISPMDEVAGIDRDQKRIVFMDSTGKLTGTLPLRATGWDIQSAEDIAFDAYGHLYVLDRTGIFVFSPYGAATAAAAAPGARSNLPTGGSERGAAFQLKTQYLSGDRPPGPFRRATSFAVDSSGGIYLFDEGAKKLVVLR